MKEKKNINFFTPKRDNGLGQWLTEEGISAGFPSPADDFRETRISLDKELVKNKDLVDQNVKTRKFKVIDARSKERFEGKAPEPREGLRSGNIKNSFCVPFNECLNENKTFKNKGDLQKIFKTCLGNINEKNIVFSCGSGVTACVLALSYSLINDKYQPCIYDGSWAEYGMI